ncbi:hypothetical protein C0995_009289 [Termitomyces sp. Mi166|nr:hypothetical protein C0995_009289 [Termitomyces sp. Mi166\
MPKNILKDGHNWLIEVTKWTPDGKPVYNPDGTLQKIKILMRDGTLLNGQPQPLCFDENSEHSRVFKGMMQISIEQGYDENVVKKKKAECPKFQCCQHILLNEPDFANVETILEACWGYAKQFYRLKPESSKEDQLLKNAIAALDAVPLESMCSLNGPQAAWAARKYQGHRVLPPTIMKELNAAGMA